MPHIDYLSTDLKKKNLLKQLALYVPQDIQKTFYQSYILHWTMGVIHRKLL